VEVSLKLLNAGVLHKSCKLVWSCSIRLFTGWTSSLTLPYVAHSCSFCLVLCLRGLSAAQRQAPNRKRCKLFVQQQCYQVVGCLVFSLPPTGRLVFFLRSFYAVQSTSRAEALLLQLVPYLFCCSVSRPGCWPFWHPLS